MRRARFRHTLRAVPGLSLTLALLAAAPAPAPAPAAPAAAAATPSPPAPPEEVTLAAPPFDAQRGMPKKDAAYFSDHFAQRLTAYGIQVINTQQITSVREMDKLRQLAGCPATSADCIIELGHMLGAKGVVRGTIAKLGELIQVDVRVYTASDGKVIAARSAGARSPETLIRALDQLAAETAQAVKDAFGIKPPPQQKVTNLPMPPPPKIVTPPPPPPKPIDWRGLAWIPAAAGVAAGAGGGIFFGMAQGERVKLEQGIPYLDGRDNNPSARQVRENGERYATLGTALAAGAGVALLGAGAMYLFGAPPSAVSVTPTPSGAKLEVRFRETPRVDAGSGRAGRVGGGLRLHRLLQHVLLPPGPVRLLRRRAGGPDRPEHIRAPGDGGGRAPGARSAVGPAAAGRRGHGERGADRGLRHHHEGRAGARRAGEHADLDPGGLAGPGPGGLGPGGAALHRHAHRGGGQDAGGSDFNDGTYLSPFQTLSRASQQSGSGDRIFVKAGTHRTIYATPAACDMLDAGLKAGVTIEGDTAGASIIDGPGLGTPGACAFNLFSGDQQVRRLTIQNFDEGIRVSNNGGLPRVADVALDITNDGVVATPGSSVLLERVFIRNSTRHGLLVDGGSVQFRDGGVNFNGRQFAGVAVYGDRAALTLDKVTVDNTGMVGTDSIRGAGVLMAADGGTLFLQEASISNNGKTALTIAGRSNTVVIDDTLLLNGAVGSIGIHATSGSAAAITLSNSRLSFSSTNILVEDFASFNGGRDGGGGNNAFLCSGGSCDAQIHDARNVTGQPMYFRNATLEGARVPAQTLTADDPAREIYIDTPGNEIIFE